MFRIFRHYLSWHALFLTVADLTILVVASFAGWLTPPLGATPPLVRLVA